MLVVGGGGISEEKHEDVLGTVLAQSGAQSMCELSLLSSSFPIFLFLVVFIFITVIQGHSQRGKWFFCCNKN